MAGWPSSPARDAQRSFRSTSQYGAIPSFSYRLHVMQAWAPLGHVAFEADYIDPATTKAGTWW